jgi:heterodisulfide reductase subunit A
MIKRALIIGAGIAGIQAALDIANSGYEVVLVEKLPSIGGHMAQLSETFPTLDCSQCILTPRTVEVGHHENIRLITYSEIDSISGQLGDFTVRIRRKAAYVNWSLCTGCGICQEKCPWKAASEFDRGIGQRKVIYTLSPQAVPNKPIIDREQCAYFQKGKCRACEKFCPVGAIDFEQQEQVIEEHVGAIVVATGFDLYPQEQLKEYGYGSIPDVIDGLQFERLLAASGPTAGKIRRPSDGATPKEVVFVQCAGSRDPERGMPYCSKICCMTAAKQAILYKHRVPDGQAYVFYIDIRAAGKGYEEFVTRAQEEDGVLYLRGKASKIFQSDGKVVVWGADTLSGEKVEIAADLVVLAMAMIPSFNAGDVAGKLNLSLDEHGFFVEAHSQLRPVESSIPGVFLAGAGLGPKDIPETVAQASGAAAKVLAMFAAC